MLDDCVPCVERGEPAQIAPFPALLLHAAVSVMEIVGTVLIDTDKSALFAVAGLSSGLRALLVVHVAARITDRPTAPVDLETGPSTWDRPALTRPVPPRGDPYAPAIVVFIMLLAIALNALNYVFEPPMGVTELCKYAAVVLAAMTGVRSLERRRRFAIFATAGCLGIPLGILATSSTLSAIVCVGAMAALVGCLCGSVGGDSTSTDGAMFHALGMMMQLVSLAVAREPRLADVAIGVYSAGITATCAGAALGA
jgi:hypothetical protein